MRHSVNSERKTGDNARAMQLRLGSDRLHDAHAEACRAPCAHDSNLPTGWKRAANINHGGWVMNRPEPLRPFGIKRADCSNSLWDGWRLRDGRNRTQNILCALVKRSRQHFKELFMRGCSQAFPIRETLCETNGSLGSYERQLLKAPKTIGGAQITRVVCLKLLIEEAHFEESSVCSSNTTSPRYVLTGDACYQHGDERKAVFSIHLRCRFRMQSLLARGARRP
jgi:hypothetical protein